VTFSEVYRLVKASPVIHGPACGLTIAGARGPVDNRKRDDGSQCARFSAMVSIQRASIAPPGAAISIDPEPWAPPVFVFLGRIALSLRIDSPRMFR
jgi:hypothetical protein